MWSREQKQVRQESKTKYQVYLRKHINFVLNMQSKLYQNEIQSVTF